MLSFSESEQVMVPAPEISLAMVEILLLVGNSVARELNDVALEMTSAQVVATALILLPDDVVEPARLLILVLAAVNESLLAFRVAALAVSLSVDWLHAMMAGIASSSYFRHLLKAPVHFFNAAAIAFASDGSLHCFIMVAVSFSADPVQQLQASDVFVFVDPIVLFRHN